VSEQALGSSNETPAALSKGMLKIGTQIDRNSAGARSTESFLVPGRRQPSGCLVVHPCLGMTVTVAHLLGEHELLVLSRSGIDLEQRNPCQMSCQLARPGGLRCDMTYPFRMKPSGARCTEYGPQPQGIEFKSVERHALRPDCFGVN